MELSLEIVNMQEQKDLVKKIVEENHSYVPTNKSVGRRIDWLIRYEGEIIGMIGIGSSVYPPPKDILRHLGKTKKEYRECFNSIANNWRYCFRRTVYNIGSQVLKKLRKQAPGAWMEKYGNKLTHIITFVGANHNGAVYLADNWKVIGQTSGLPSARKAVSMKWNTGEEIKKQFVKPTGENKKIIFIKEV
jgi:hypothetical protein